MSSEYGKEMNAALKAVLQMHSDCSRLLLDLDSFMPSYRPVYGSLATTDLSYDIKRGRYMAEGLLRHWITDTAPNEVIAVNIAFFEAGILSIPEPLFIAAKLVYTSPVAAKPDTRKAWDPWTAYLKWNTHVLYDEIIELRNVVGRTDISQVAVIAVPLFTISNEVRAQHIVQQMLDYKYAVS